MNRGASADGTSMDGVQPDGSVARAWATVRAHLRESAGARLFDQWLKPMTLLPGVDAESVRLALPSAFMRRMLPLATVV